MLGQRAVTWAVASAVALVFTLAWTWPLDSGSNALDFRYFEFLFEAFRAGVVVHGEFPSWNPYACGGYPLHANPQSPFLSPLAWPALVLGAVPGLKLFALAHLVIAVLGALRLGRDLGLSNPASWLLAIAFAGSARFAWLLQGGQMAMLTYAFFPWLLSFSLRALVDLRASAWAGAVLALMVLEGGTSGVPLAVLLLVAFSVASVFGLVRPATPNPSATIYRINPRPLVAAGITLAVGFFLSLPKTWPVLAYLADHPRPVSPKDDALSLTQVALMFFARRAAPYLIDPSSEPALSGLHYRWWGEYGAYLGPLVPAFAVIGVVFRPRRTVTWLALAVLFFLIMLGQHGPAFPYEWLRHLPIYRDLRVPSRYSILVVLMLAVVAAHGLDEMRARVLAVRKRGVGTLPWILLAFIVADHAAFSNQVLGSIGKRATTPDEPFVPRLTPVNVSGTDLATTVRRGLASLDCYDPLFERTDYRSPVHSRLARMSSPVEAPTVVAARLTLVEWTPNRIKFVAVLPSDTTVLVRQNYDRGWRADVGDVNDDRGLLAVRLKAGTHVVTLRHRPQGIEWGFVFMTLTALGLAVLGLKRRPSPWRSHS